MQKSNPSDKKSLRWHKMNLKRNWLVKFKQKNILDLVKLFLFFFILFTFSFNLFYKLSIDGAYVRGLLVDYLIPKIYLTELFLFPFLAIGLKQLKKIKIETYLCFLILFLLGRQLLSQSPLAALVQLLHLFEVLLFFAVSRRAPMSKLNGQKIQLGAILSVIIFFKAYTNLSYRFFKNHFGSIIFWKQLLDLANISKVIFFRRKNVTLRAPLRILKFLAGVM
jgi:hypothetical protein